MYTEARYWSGLDSTHCFFGELPYRPPVSAAVTNKSLKWSEEITTFTFAPLRLYRKNLLDDKGTMNGFTYI